MVQKCIMSEQMMNSREIDEAVFEVGKESLEVIQRFVSGRVSREDLEDKLASLQVNQLLTKYWGELTSNAQYLPHWRVLQTLQGVVDEISYQLAEYGESTLFDDLKDIAASLKQISEKLNNN